MKYALTNGIILNGKKDMEPLTGYSIIVEDGRIKEITKNKITIVIAHRLSTIKECNKIILLKNGKIVESN